MKALKYIGIASLIALLLFGFFNFLIADNFFRAQESFVTYKSVAGKVMIALTGAVLVSWGLFMFSLLKAGEIKLINAWHIKEKRSNKLELKFRIGKLTIIDLFARWELHPFRLIPGQYGISFMNLGVRNENTEKNVKPKTKY